MTVSNETISNPGHAIEPQLTGLITPADIEASLQDPLTISMRNDSGQVVPVITPVIHNSEANQAFFSETQSPVFFLSARDFVAYAETDIDHQRVDRVLQPGSFLMVEQVEGDVEARPILEEIAVGHGKVLELDPDAVDVFNDTVAGVHHFYSPVTRDTEPDVSFATLREAHAALRNRPEWLEYEAEGLYYVNGVDIDPELMERLWEVYDETFDMLVSNHPSAQKQPKDAFIAQCQQPFSSITYVQPEQGGEIYSALFMVDDTIHCNWLNQDFFNSRNPSGNTAFVPAVSTRLERQGLSLSPKTMGAMAWLAYHVPSFTGFATQCTNRSVDYIPRLSQESTVGTVNLNFEPTATYRYPVYIVREAE